MGREIMTVIAAFPIALSARILPPSEWPKLAGTELETVWPLLPRDTATVIVVERGDVIVGCWSVFPCWHVECAWVAPSERKHVSVVRRLIHTMRTLLRERGIPHVATAALTPDVESILSKLAEPLPGKHYLWKVS